MMANVQDHNFLDSDALSWTAAIKISNDINDCLHIILIIM